jgi:hypothetical protein
MKATILAVLGLSGAFLQATAQEVEFVRLPEVARTTVVRETSIPDYSSVTRVVRDRGGVYEVTVRRDDGDAVVYVDDAGRLVRQTVISREPARAVVRESAPVVRETYTEVEEMPTVQTIVRNLSSNRYQLIEKKKSREVYLDRATGEKWRVTVERED